MSMLHARQIAALERKSEEMSLAIERLTKQVEKLKPKRGRPSVKRTPIAETGQDAAVNG